jgi:hypothetical protein
MPVRGGMIVQTDNASGVDHRWMREA